ncbi:MAG: pyridoxal phosphate-dependent aminotransferase [Rhizobiaceae bacterium]
MTDRLPLTPLARLLPDTVPFVGPEAQERTRGRPFRARLGANENGFGPSPRVVAAMAEAAGEMWKYCDPDNFDLKVAIAAHLGLRADNVAVGEGIDGLLGLTVRLFVKEGNAVVTSLGAYPTFNYHVAGFGGRLVTVPYRDDREDLDALLDAVKRESAPLVYLSNPDNPMGTWWNAADIEAFMDALPHTTIFILDEAYGETAPAEALPAFDVSRPNLVRMRTFSKAYGLAGLRCGYAVGHEDTIRVFEKVRNHYGMNRMAQAGCLAALHHQDNLAEIVARTAAGRQRIAEIAADHGLDSLPSATNFVAIDCGLDGAFALKVMQELLSRDIFVRKPMVPGLDRTVRISVGPEYEIELFGEAFGPALEAARQGS